MGGKIGLFVLSDDADDVSGLRALLQAALQMLAATPTETPDNGGPFPTGHIETDTDNQGRIVVPEGTAPAELSTAIKKVWPKSLWGDAARVSFHESSWNPQATNDTRHLGGGQCGVRYWLASAGIYADTEYSVGYFQINICAHGEDAAHWYNADNNVQKAWELYSARGGWGDWAYTAGQLGLL